MTAVLVRLFLRAVSCFVFNPLSHLRPSSNGGILVFHRVASENTGNRLPKLQSQDITPVYLERLVKHLKRRKYIFVSLDTLHKCFTGVHSISKPVCFTFDDGYKDVLQEVYPILKRHQIPFTVYLTTRFIDGTIPPWRHHVEELVSAVSNVDLELGTSSYRIKCGSATEKLSAFNKVIQVAEQLPRSDFLYFLSSLRSAQRRAGLESNVSYLTWDDVAILSNDPLVTIGAHTVNHPRLSSLPEAECFAEMIDSKNLIEQKIGRPVRHFCYPYGNETDVGVREFRLAEDAGFLTATTSTQAALSPGLFLRGSRYLTRLPRIPGTSLWVNENAELIDYWFNGSASSLAAVYVYAKKLLS